MSDLTGKFEPEARDAMNATEAALTSIAVSLKRIADALAGSDTNMGLTDTLFSMERSLRHD